jgi:CheY-like chemotaxis protein
MEALMPPQEVTLLIVDDEPLLTDVFRQWMTKRGFRVLTASSGQEAISTVAAQGGAVQLVITDMAMPDMSGLELARSLYTQFPDLPVLIATGYDLDPGEIDLTPNVVEIVRKPYQNRALAERIREILKSRE